MVGRTTPSPQLLPHQESKVAAFSLCGGIIFHTGKCPDINHINTKRADQYEQQIVHICPSLKCDVLSAQTRPLPAMVTFPLPLLSPRVSHLGAPPNKTQMWVWPHLRGWPTETWCITCHDLPCQLNRKMSMKYFTRLLPRERARYRRANRRRMCANHEGNTPCNDPVVSPTGGSYAQCHSLSSSTHFPALPVHKGT